MCDGLTFCPHAHLKGFNMKKIIGFVLIIVSILTTSIGAALLFKAKSNVTATSDIAIIGGADYPTSIFLAEKAFAPLYGAIIFGIVIFVIGLLLVLLKKKQEQ